MNPWKGFPSCFLRFAESLSASLRGWFVCSIGGALVLGAMLGGCGLLGLVDDQGISWLNGLRVVNHRDVDLDLATIDNDGNLWMQSR